VPHFVKPYWYAKLPVKRFCTFITGRTFITGGDEGEVPSIEMLSMSVGIPVIFATLDVEVI